MVTALACGPRRWTSGLHAERIRSSPHDLPIQMPCGVAEHRQDDVSEDAPASEPLPSEAQADDEHPGDGGRIEIELPKGIRVRVIPPVDTTVLTHVLQALSPR